ncbi:hypothetical protein FEM48_Zijuj12G0051000 [Ziziphus jujuba var. spinosa]|uniref:Wall-associated receptor kinase galacturonan-binding domain-containing protein n=1 Tax=Ziziphus jujuba var. spinosa TaxID=714518 RepID=A0A978UBC3_ZIZJJ|nr:hypothetical protein FEM48_Zijuj12G0051000 [Ziziphus jujuba var. spinosa]
MPVFPYSCCFFFFFLLCLCHFCSSLKTCPACGQIEIPYPLSTSPNCGDPHYPLRCDFYSQKLYFDALNGSSYRVLRIMAPFQRLVIQPSPWLSASCVTQDMPVSEGIWLNQSLPFNITSSNTVFLLNCSPRLLVSPLNCTPSSLCHRYLESSGHVDSKRAAQCTSGVDPCCTFIAGGMPSAYKIRLHSSGCRAFRSILHLDIEKPANEWEEGLEIQWVPPPEPVCKTQMDCSGASKCSPTSVQGILRCLCNKGYHWDHVHGTCSKNKGKTAASLSIKVSSGVISFFIVAAILAAIGNAIDFSRDEDDVNLAIFVSQRAKTGALMEIVDQHLLDKEEASSDILASVKLFLDLALACLREKKEDRPAMKDVVQQLHYIIQVLNQEVC